jgi:hypothetical protein
LAGFGWLTRGISVGFHHPKPLLGGAAFLLLAVILPSLVTLPIQMYSLRAGAQPSPAAFGWIMLVSMLLGLLIVPLYAGYLQVIDAAERGVPVRAIDVFKPYRQGEILRLVGYGLALIVIYVVMIGLVIAAAGGGIASWYMQVLAAQTNHQPPPGLPAGFGIAMTLFMVLGLFMMGFYAISLGQVALGRRSVFAAAARVHAELLAGLDSLHHRLCHRGHAARADRQAGWRMAALRARHSALYRHGAGDVRGDVRRDVPPVA